MTFLSLSSRCPQEVVFLGTGAFNDQNALQKCVDQEAVREVEPETFLC